MTTPLSPDTPPHDKMRCPSFGGVTSARFQAAAFAYKRAYDQAVKGVADLESLKQAAKSLGKERQFHYEEKEPFPFTPDDIRGLRKLVSRVFVTSAIDQLKTDDTLSQSATRTIIGNMHEHMRRAGGPEAFRMTESEYQELRALVGLKPRALHL